ncbi:MAG TPA: class I SAM-dependent methyltransferase [Jatrophihabitantaceae bacterium]|nr:class I SAM-dependent methyltransferase [Jatrophihabitantaceae bacterium]
MAQDHFGADVADSYDDAHADMADEALLASTVTFLAEHAGGGPVLEFAIGTGRVALPLAATGLAVSGLDLSTAMLDRLRAKPGAESIAVTTGDIAHERVPGRFRLVYLVYNTIMNLTAQREQVACFRNAAAHLEPGGRFVLEVMVPDLQRLPFGETIRPFELSATRLGFDEYDVVNQGLVSHYFRIDGERGEHTSIPFRYGWPAEFDLMAELAGMTLLERWADWDRAPFTSTSEKHVSVWQRNPSP